jgi:putative metallohydrolase (TIGR04338 family)
MNHELRDFQRTKVYRAEKKHSKSPDVFWHDADTWDGFRADSNGAMSFEETKTYVDKIARSRYWRRTLGMPRGIAVRDGRGRRNAGAFGSAIIKLPRWSRHPLVILHEMAHCATDKSDTSAHGATFCRNFLGLVKRFMGREDWLELKTLFKEGGVKVISRKPKWQ